MKEFPQASSDIHMSPEPRTAAEEKHFKKQGYIVLLGGVLIHLVIGTFYLWGGISLYVASYLRSYDEAVSIENVKGIFPFMMLAINAMPSFGIKLGEKIGFKLTIISCILIYSLAVFICSFIKNFFIFAVVYALIAGIANGLIYMIPVVIGLKYFPGKKGFVSGVIIAGYGFGSFIFNFVALNLVNPDNLSPSVEVHDHLYFTEDVYSNVPFMLRILAICYVVLGTAGALLIRVPTTDQIKHHEEFVMLTQEHEHKVIEEHHDCSTISQGVHCRPFWVLITMGCLGPFFGLLMANNYKIYGIAQGHSDSFVTIVGSIGSAANGCSRLLWAMLYDKFGFRRVYMIIMAIQLVLAATMGYISKIGALYIIWQALTLGCEGGQFSTLPAVTTKVFGHKVGPLIYGFVLVSFAIANIGSFFMTKFGLESLGWNSMFWISFALTALSAIMNFFFNEKYKFL